ncbi:MAG: KilA-N domain-containing protein, partial [Microcystis sp.]
MEIILHETNGLQIGQRRDDGYINATRMCQAHNKEWRYYWRLPSTQEYVNALAEDLGIPVIVNNPTCNFFTSALVVTFRGGNSQQGTWVHPEVAIDLAAWISVEFRVLVNRWVREWMTTAQNPIQPQPPQIPSELLKEINTHLKTLEALNKVMHTTVHQHTG